ncbi:MAG: hypothetical protein M3R00_09105, partial [Pseudomonadota bacterium]|nr:hypothetical protein [Pseudomonadota bacterium]
MSKNKHEIKKKLHKPTKSANQYSYWKIVWGILLLLTFALGILSRQLRVVKTNVDEQKLPKDNLLPAPLSSANTVLHKPVLIIEPGQSAETNTP